MADMTAAHNMRAKLDWIDERGGVHYDTLADVKIELDGEWIWPVWGDPNTNLDVFTDDLLSFLVENWKRLLLEQYYPRRLKPYLPSNLWATAKSVASAEPRQTALALYSAVEAFEDAHDLSKSIGGQFGLPSFWMVRQGDGMLVETAGRAVLLTLDTWTTFAIELGQSIAERVRERSKEKYDRLLKAWEQRDSGDALRILSLSIGQSPEITENLVQEGLLRLESSVSIVANDNDLLRVAARMVGPAPYLQIVSILSTIADTPAGPSVVLDRFATATRLTLHDLSTGSAPHEEGVHAARRFRELMEISPERRSDPFVALDRMQVPVTTKSLRLASLDALAVWGERHGPSVVINVDSRRLAGKYGFSLLRPAARATAAHEICHLLLDRDRSLAAVDILNGRMPEASEKRAGAFAAEFLLPANVAATHWRRSELAATREGVVNILKRLSNRFIVSRQMAAWQLDHGLLGAEPDVIFWLDEIYPQRRERGGHRY